MREYHMSPFVCLIFALLISSDQLTKQCDVNNPNQINLIIIKIISSMIADYQYFITDRYNIQMNMGGPVK